MKQLFSVKNLWVPLIIAVVLLGGCGAPSSPQSPTPSPPPVPAPTPAPEPAPPPVTAPPEQVTPPPPPPAPEPIPPQQPLPTPPPAPPVKEPVMPSFVIITSDYFGSDLFGKPSATITATYRFTTAIDPGYYAFTLVSGNETIGTTQLEWYRADKEERIIWRTLAGSQPYQRLINGERAENLFKTQVTYRKFRSINVVSDNPTSTETELVNLINRERSSRSLPALSWDTDLYKQAIQRIKECGEEGAITKPAAGLKETNYTAGAKAEPKTNVILDYWIVQDAFRDIITSPAITSAAVRLDIWDNSRFYAIALYK